MMQKMNLKHNLNINMPNKFNIVLCGFMGSGKTTVGKKLSNYTGLKFIDTDTYVEKKVGHTINQIFNKYGETYFRNIEKDCVKEISSKTDYIISTGGGTILNKSNVDNLKKSGKIIFINVSFDIITYRLSKDNTRPLIKNSDINSIEELFKQRQEKYQLVSDIMVDGTLSIDEICKDIISKVELLF